MRIANNFPILKSALMGVGLIALLGATALADPLPIPAPDAGATSMIVTAPSSSANSLEKTVGALEDKAIADGKNSAKQLDTTSETTTFEDLNSARQSVARIDALIEIEKHLAELQKLRSERNGGGSFSGLANAIPASALTPPPHMVMQPMSAAVMPVIHPVTTSEEVVRILGVEGRYSAVLKMSDGTSRTVKPGDEIPHGRVSWITPSAVGVDEDGKSRSLHVKNVEIVYSTIR